MDVTCEEIRMGADVDVTCIYVNTRRAEVNTCRKRYSVVWISMTWLTATEYLCHKWPQICSICPKGLPGSFLVHDLSRACNYSNTTGAISEARRTAYASEALKFIPGFFWPLCCHSSFYGFWLPLWYLQTPHTKIFSPFI